MCTIQFSRIEGDFTLRRRHRLSAAPFRFAHSTYSFELVEFFLPSSDSFFSNHRRVASRRPVSVTRTLLSVSSSSRVFIEVAILFRNHPKRLAAPRLDALNSTQSAELVQFVFVVSADFTRSPRRLIYPRLIHFSPCCGKAVRIDCQRTDEPVSPEAPHYL